MTDDFQLFIRYFVAEQLGKMVWELGAMPHAELIGWIAYFRLRNRK